MPNNTPLRIGITGGIGAGKSTICHIFAALGVPIYEADSRARWLMTHDAALKTALIQHFGTQTYTAEGTLNREYLAAQVFNDGDKVQLLNSLVHPRVGEDYAAWVAAHPQSPYLLNEAALMFEAGRHQSMHKIITVFAPLELRIARIQARDPQRSPAEIMAIIAKQMPEEEKMAKADFVIYNDDVRAVLPQVLALHQQLHNKPIRSARTL